VSTLTHLHVALYNWLRLAARYLIRPLFLWRHANQERMKL
jgi:hypothetical protein